MKLSRKNTSHRDGVYWISSYDIYRGKLKVGRAYKTGTAQDNYPWDWELSDGIESSWKRDGHTGLLSEAMEEIDYASADYE